MYIHIGAHIDAIPRFLGVIYRLFLSEVAVGMLPSMNRRRFRSSGGFIMHVDLSGASRAHSPPTPSAYRYKKT